MKRLIAFSLALALSTAPLTAAPPQKKPNPPSIAGGGGGGTAKLPDPKYPGSPLLLLSWQSVEAHQISSTDLLGTLQGVEAKFYQKGIPSATLTAPVAHADIQRRVVTASRRVHCRSLIERGTTLTADNMTWYALQNKVVASGHVVYHNGLNGLTINTGLLYADTALRGIHASTGGKTVLPKGF